MPTIINGWEYMTDIYPGSVKSQTIQDNYLMEYNLAYHTFINSLCIDKDLIFSNNNNNNKYILNINCEEKNNIINNNNYGIKFLKSKFLINKNKKLKNDLINYYKPIGIYVKNPYTHDNINYVIELCWNN